MAIPDPYGHTMFRGVPLDWATVQACKQAEDRLGYELTITQGIGGAEASAGTHNVGRVIDLAPYHHQTKVRVMRDLGFAAWYRPAVRDLWPEHIHCVLIFENRENRRGIARAGFTQIGLYDRGLNGLADLAPDPNPYRPNPRAVYTRAEYERSFAPMDTTSIRVATANIRNNLSDTEVHHDIRAMAEVSGLIFWQEMGEPEDRESLGEVLGAEWRTTQVDHENLISWRASRFAAVGEPTVTNVPPVASGVPGAVRWFTTQRLRWRGDAGRRGLPDVFAIAGHLVQRAWSDPPPDDAEARRIAWRHEWDWARDQALAAQREGLIVVMGADWNRWIPDIPLFGPGHKWVAGGAGGIDAVLCMAPRAVHIETDATVATPLNSDHDGKSARVRFTWRPTQ